uniref:Uncharacterized protein n=1 Tax=Romanomermis culicivorax TaxID=13658 RepID=A0A915L6C6_ROMCU
MKKRRNWGWKRQPKAQAYLQSAHWGGQDHVAATEDDIAVLVSMGPCLTTSTSSQKIADEETGNRARAVAGAGGVADMASE